MPVSARGNYLEQIPEARWETIIGYTERIDANLVKVTLEGRTAAPRSKRVGATTIIDDRTPYDYQHKMRRMVRWLEQAWVV